jgi:TonB-linked SusC/RagA family outer membrane protein
MYKFYTVNGYGLNSRTKYLPSENKWLTIFKDPNLKGWIMRINLTCILVFFAFLQFSVAADGQLVTLTKKSTPLTKIFKEIKRQTGYDFVYESNLLKTGKQVDIQAKNEPLIQVLNECFENQPFTYSIKDKTIILQKKDAANSSSNKPVIVPVSISGRVLDTTNLPLPGVTVKIKGGKSVTITDADGKFTLQAPDNSVLVFSFIGFTTKELPVTPGREMIIHLQAKQSDLNEVVVVAFGTQKKIDLTGAVDQISAKQLQDRPTTNVGDALQGLMANLNITTSGNGQTGGGAPGATKNINVRGFTNLSGGLGGPLILVDGVETDINSLNPNDIESISLLKDAASSAVYGSRAPNGVLLITTKQGKKNQAPQFTYSDNFSFSQPINVPVMSNSLVWANTYNEAQINNNGALFINQGILDRIVKYINDPINTPTTVAQTNGVWANAGGGNSNNDWFKVYLKPWSPAQQHNFSVSGGNDKITYFVGAGTENKNGSFNYFADSYKRNNIRANLTADINKFITFSLKTSFAQTNNNTPYNGGANTGSNFFHQIARTFPTNAIYDPNGGLDLNSYIAQIQQGGRNLSRSNLSSINGDITIRPLPGWDITGQYNYNYNSYNINSSILPFYSATTTDPHSISNTVSAVNEDYQLTSYYSYNAFTSYQKQIGGHYFKIMVGGRAEQKTYQELAGNAQNLYNLAQPSLSLSNGTQSTGDAGYSWATNSLIGRFNYNYNEKYLLEVNGSYMGTSLFPVDTRFHLFPSASAGWNISKESFFKPLTKSIDNFKFRLSYGGLGDINTLLGNGNYYPYISTLGNTAPTGTNWIFTPSNGGRQPAISNPALVSPTITWTKPSMFDAGVDVTFLNDFTATFDWYSKNITDQLGPAIAAPATLGIAAPQINNASSTTQGWDLTASWQHRFNQVNLMARATLSHYSGKITQYGGNLNKAINQLYAGEQLGTIWGYRTLGKFQSQAQVASSPSQSKIGPGGFVPGDIQYADLNNDGVIGPGAGTVDNPGDQEIIGNSTPKYFYGLTTAGSWKGIDLSIFIQGQGPASYMPSNNYFWGLTSTYQSTITPKLADRWTPSNPNGYFPRLDLINGAAKNQIAQSGYLLNTAYMRLKNVQLGYTIPNRLTQALHLYQVRFYGSVENVLTISGAFKHQYVDPELLQSDEKIYPLQRTVSFGVRLNIK